MQILACQPCARAPIRERTVSLPASIARVLFGKLLENCKAVLGIDQGQYSEAEKILRSVVEVRAQVFGSEHPDTLQSRNRLAYALWRQGHHAEADANFRQVVILEEKYSALRIQTIC